MISGEKNLKETVRQEDLYFNSLIYLWIINYDRAGLGPGEPGRDWPDHRGFPEKTGKLQRRKVGGAAAAYRRKIPLVI